MSPHHAAPERRSAAAAVYGAVLAAALALCALYLDAERRQLGGGFGLSLDDSWIHLQFARRMAAGDGLSYNPGQWVAGSTSPLWTALLALLHQLPGNVVLWLKALGIGCFLLTVDAARRLARELGLGAAWATVAAATVAASHWLVWSALSGMEVPLAAALGLWGMVLHLRERRRPGRLPASLPVLALGLLARPELALLLLLAVLDRCLRWRRSGDGALRLSPALDRGLLEGLLLAALVLAPTLVFYRAIGGSWLPATFAVKGAQPALALPDGRYLRVVIDILFRSQPLLLLATAAGAVRLLSALGSERDRGLLPALWPFLLPLAYALMTPAGGVPAVGNFGRYYFPLLPAVAVLGLYGLAPAAARLGTLGLGARRVPLAALLAVLLLAPQALGLGRGPAFHARTVQNVEASDVAAARWLAARVPPAALLAVQDIGALKYHLPNPVLDLAGIVTPEILPHLRAAAGGYWEERLLGFLDRRQPDYLVVFAASYPLIAGRTPGFQTLATFTVDHNVTMAGDRLLVLSTPWTRHPLRAVGDAE